MYLTVKQQVKHLSKEDYRTLRDISSAAEEYIVIFMKRQLEKH